MIKNRRDFLKWAGAVSGMTVMASSSAMAQYAHAPLVPKIRTKIVQIWHEERLRASLALAFYKTHGTDLFQTMGTWSATNRAAVLNELIKLYNIDLSELPDGKLLYETRQLVEMPLGTFPSTALTQRFDALKNEGSASLEAALLVMTKVTVENIDTIQSVIAANPSKKIAENLHYLADGAMAHYWTINQILINQKVVEGCCKAGTRYCKTPKEYPIAYGADHIDSDLTLTGAQRHALAHMWSEEKMAHDAFEAVYGLYPQLRLFYNIGHWSEVQHMTAVEELVALYNIDVNDYGNADAHYKPDVLRGMGAGDYAISDFETRYNETLIPLAKQGPIKALQLGCIVEVQDIYDLTGFLGQVGNNPYLKRTFEYLVAGSQSHYWAYHYALIAHGVSNGCCSAGGDYCKSASEYPSGSGDETLAWLWQRHEGDPEKIIV